MQVQKESMSKHSAGWLYGIFAAASFYTVMIVGYASRFRQLWFACLVVGSSLYVHSEFGYRPQWQPSPRRELDPGTYEIYHGWPIRNKYQLMSNSGVPFIVATGSSARYSGNTSEIFPIPLLPEEFTDLCDWNILFWCITVCCTFVFVRAAIDQSPSNHFNSSVHSFGTYKLKLRSVLFYVTLVAIFIKIVCVEHLALTHFGISFGLGCVLFELPLMPIRAFNLLNSAFKNTP